MDKFVTGSQCDMFLPTLNLDEAEARAIALLCEHCPDAGFYVAFSGGKDSIVIKKLCQLAGVKFDAHYNNTTIDPPELVRFIKRHHADVGWNNPELPMMKGVAEFPKIPPTRAGRWCCEIWKEGGGEGRVTVIGVRASESPGRARRWSEVSQDKYKNVAICPIVYWSTEMVWEFIAKHKLPYCELYDQGFTRLGCVGCPLGSKDNQAKEFARWPRYEANWKKAIIANWEKWHAVPREKDGLPRYHAKFKSGEELWEWWRNYKAPADPLYEDCQSGLLWTNQPEDDIS